MTSVNLWAIKQYPLSDEQIKAQLQHSLENGEPNCAFQLSDHVGIGRDSGKVVRILRIIDLYDPEHPTKSILEDLDSAAHSAIDYAVDAGAVGTLVVVTLDKDQNWNVVAMTEDYKFQYRSLNTSSEDDMVTFAFALQDLTGSTVN